MDEYKVKVTRQAKEHLALIREYIATELKAVSYTHLTLPTICSV